MTTAQFALGWLCVVVIVGMFVWIGIALHMAYTKMDLMLTHLKNCSAIMIRAPLRHGGPWGKLLLVGGISGIVTFPGFYLKRGGMSVEDLSNFPVALKRKLAVLQWSVIALLLVMLSLAAVIKLGLV
ncbi:MULTISPECIES: hypothetical protein [Pseudomonas]|uniref:hypothetical protein n=1 Tax=Pseudomonas TaxID=286 RepID=UPI001C0A899E|nr:MULTISPECIES: hypothetical protein [Pseudomonas]MCK3838924.1 hypothetical protein [Pseudomonas sp. NCIMB 10586]VCU65975.1 hypothetical protein [Pseudomonas synxantha]